jgi:hypothetical protein
MTTRANKYSDLDISMKPHPGQVLASGKGDLVLKTDENAVKQSLRNLIQFNTGDKPFHPDIASNVRRLLFENVDILTGAILKRNLSDIISIYEPRVIINSIDVSINNDDYEALVNIVFTIINTSNPVRLEIAIERSR